MVKCPLTKEDCLGDNCAWWVRLRSSKQEDDAKCSVAWATILLVELKMVVEQGVKGSGQPSG